MANFYKSPTLIDIKEEDLVETPPSEIGGYKIESLLNRGGMSLLYLGLHPETHEPIAIKVLLSKYVSNPEMVERFMREAAIIELTDHPNIVKLYGHGKWAGGVYIAMEFIQGISLRQLIVQQAMSLKRALEIVLQIGHALTHLHAHGIIHRDLKPENILLTAQGGVKVIDFGISQLHTEKGEKRMLGTPTYMSPEQQKDPLHVSFSTDLYSLGVITYELALGRLSYGTIHLSLIPKGLQKILAKALQQKPEDRYEDIVDFIKAISLYLSSEELKQDMRASDFVGEICEDLRSAQTLFIPKQLPKWNRLEMALVSNFSTAVSSVYYDFFKANDNTFCIVMAESLKTGVEGFLQSALLKGMVRAYAHIIESPQEFVSNLRSRIAEEGENQRFSFSFLALYPTEERLSYISCGYSPLWYLPAAAHTPRRMISDNPELGVLGAGEILKVESSFHVGDRVVLHTFQAGQAKHVEEIEADEALFLDGLMENLFFPPQKQAEAILRKVTHREKHAFFEKQITVIAIERIE